MRSAMITAWILGGLSCLSGCTGGANPFVAHIEPVVASTRSEEQLWSTQTAIANSSVERHEDTVAATSSPSKRGITTVGHQAVEDECKSETITIDGQTYGIQLVDHDKGHGSDGRNLQEVPADPDFANASNENESSPGDAPFSLPPDEVGIVAETQPNATLLNLPSALSMVDGDHPAVGFARWKVQEAYANLEQAQVLWLPDIQTGFSIHRHDGNYQASNGGIVDVNRSSFQFGFGAGATGAGTTPVPGLRAKFHLADAIFQPDIAQKTAWATDHSEKAVVNRQLRDVALAYIRLLDAHQQLRILQDVRDRTQALSKITNDFAEAGEGLRADADRMQTELALVNGRITTAREQVDVTSAKLAYELSADSANKIVPMDPTVVPLELVSSELDKGSLISSGLTHRPELKELQALVCAACDRYQRQTYAPFVPSVLLGLSAGGFGGGTGNSINSVDDRYDVDAIVTWEVRNLGFGEQAARRRTQAQVQQATFRKLRLIDDVAREITEAHTRVTHRRELMAVTKTAIQSAQDSYDRNLSRIRDGEGLPIEVLQSVKALEAARVTYLDAVVAFNEAQFQLQWAIGWQVSAPDDA